MSSTDDVTTDDRVIEALDGNHRIGFMLAHPEMFPPTTTVLAYVVPGFPPQQVQLRDLVEPVVDPEMPALVTSNDVTTSDRLIDGLPVYTLMYAGDDASHRISYMLSRPEIYAPTTMVVVEVMPVGHHEHVQLRQIQTLEASVEPVDSDSDMPGLVSSPESPDSDGNSDEI